MLYHVRNQNADRMYRYHSNALSEITQAKMIMIIVEVFFICSSTLETLSAQTRAVNGFKGYAIPYNIHTQAKAPPPNCCCTSHSSQNPTLQLHAMHICSDKEVAAAESRRR